jgi:hypothetical protein
MGGDRDEHRYLDCLVWRHAPETHNTFRGRAERKAKNAGQREGPHVAEGNAWCERPSRKRMSHARLAVRHTLDVAPCRGLAQAQVPRSVLAR